MSIVPVVILTKEEARACVERIQAGIDGIRAEVLRLHEGEGWRVLGYESWRECVTAEFGQSQGHLYRLLEAAKIEREISPIGETPDSAADWTIGQKPVSIPESHLRELTPLKDRPDEMRAAYQAAAAKNDGKLTAAAIKAEVVTIIPPKAMTPGERDRQDAITRMRQQQEQRDRAQSETPTQQGQRYLSTVGDEEGKIARAKLKQALSDAIVASRNLWALREESLAGVIDDAERLSVRETIRDGRRWFDNMERAMSRGVHIVREEVGG